VIKYYSSVIKIFIQCSQVLERSILWIAVIPLNDYFYITDTQYFLDAAVKHCKGR